MAPKRKISAVAKAVAAMPARVTRSSTKLTRSPGRAVNLTELPDSKKVTNKKQKKAEVKGKGKGKAVEEEKVEEEKAEEDSENEEVKAVEGGEASEKVPEEVPDKAVIVIEHCKQCKSFQRTALQVKDGLEASDCDVIVQLNPEKPRKGCFEVRQQGGKTFVSLLDMKRPFEPMKELDMDKVVSDIVAELSNAD